MKTRSLLTLAFAVAAAVVGTVGSKSLAPPDSPSGSLAVPLRRAELPIVDRSGEKIDLPRRRDKLVIMHFWATWCPPCVEEMPALSRSGSNTRSATTSPSMRSPWTRTGRRSTTSSRRTRASCRCITTPKEATAKRFGTSQYPETYIVNRKGRVLYRVQGAVDWDDPEIRNRIEQLLAS